MKINFHYGLHKSILPLREKISYLLRGEECIQVLLAAILILSPIPYFSSIDPQADMSQ